jgi:diguanylate cyclase (GGDEF)-like protein
MEDLFGNEQKVLDNAFERIAQRDTIISLEEYKALAKEYRGLLKQLRRSTRLADRTTGDLVERNQDLQEMALIDPLTSLFNRRYLDETLPRNIKSLSRSGDWISILMIDIDHFKKFNDTYGHPAGDACLRDVARGLLKCVTRGGDYVVRYGGEEFTVVLPHTDENGGRNIARELLSTVIDLEIPHEKNEKIGCVTISIGVTSVQPIHTNKGPEYIKRADQALYSSKKTGRNRYTYLAFEEDS